MNILKIIRRISFCVVLIVCGYLIHDIPQHKQGNIVPHPPKRSGIPSVFYESEYHSLLGPPEIRNGIIEKFFWAWKNNERYAVYDYGPDFDSILSLYWVTEGGKVQCLLIDDEGLFRHKSIMYYNVAKPNLFYSDDNEDRATVFEPEIFENRDFVMTHKLGLSFLQLRGN
jgi:hypothetical protein